MAREKYEYMQAGLVNNNYGTVPMLRVDKLSGTVQYHDSNNLDGIHGTASIAAGAAQYKY